MKSVNQLCRTTNLMKMTGFSAVAARMNCEQTTSFLNTSRRRTPARAGGLIPMTTLPVTYGYARVSKSDDEAKNLETQLRLLADHGIRQLRRQFRSDLARANLDPHFTRVGRTDPILLFKR